MQVETLGTIMVVDDNPNNLSLLVDLLKNASYKVRPVNRGETAINLALRQHDGIDLILLDILMPEMDGFEVCAKLKAEPLTRDIPVIFISALHEPLDKIKAFETGAVDYLSKPFHAAEVLVRVNTHIELYRLRRSLARQVQRRTAELETTNSALRKALEVKQEFLSVIQHELRTPLNVVLGTLSLIKSNAGQLSQEHLAMLNEGSSRLLQLGNNLLALSAMGVEKHHEENSQVDVAELCRECAELFRPIAQRKHIDFQVQVPDSLPLPLPMKASCLRQVLQNILDNAFKFTPDSGTVELEVFNHPGSFLCHVRDTGIGIPADAYDKIFEPFTQLSSGISRHYEGAGLGLSVAANLVKLHNGRLRVYPNEQQGSLFEIMLPYPTP